MKRTSWRTRTETSSARPRTLRAREEIDHVLYGLQTLRRRLGEHRADEAEIDPIRIVRCGSRDGIRASILCGGWGVRELGLRTPDSHANFSWIALDDTDEGELVASLADQGIVVRAGAPLGGPGHIRVSYGTADQNRRFLAARADAI